MPFSEKNIIIENTLNDEGEPYQRRYFLLTVEQMRRILDSLGYTINAAKDNFEHSKAEDLDYIECFLNDEEEISLHHDNIQKNFTFDSWREAAQKYARLLANDTFDYHSGDYYKLKNARLDPLTIAEQIVIDSLPFGDSYFGMHYEYINMWNIFRVLLDAFEKDVSIVLDYTDLYESGYCGEYPREEDYGEIKTIILTEGSFDAAVMSKAIDILYPYMSKFYSFINFDRYKIQGSTNFLTHYLKVFAAAKIQNRVIAIYDNDSAGLAELESLKHMHYPENFKILHLPNIELAKNYPTLGPNGMEKMDVNGKACSIEMFLGKDVLKTKDDLSPVHWKGFIEKTQTYQGEVMYKKEIQTRFWEKINSSNKEISLNAEMWNEMHILLNSIFNAFL